MIHAAAALWRTRLKVHPGVGISARGVGGRVSASIRQGTPLIDLAEATDARPTEFELFDTRADNFSVAAIANACAGPIV